MAVASTVSVLRRRFRVLGGSPAAARRVFSACPASQAARTRWLRTMSRQFRRLQVEEQREVLSLIGDVAESQDGPVAHAA